jgi:peptide-methionine (S)-S-oxide reductase
MPPISDFYFMKKQTETVTLGAGCFWCIEAIYKRLKGVTSVKSGYTGGTTKHPTYKEICEGNSGHAEVCEIQFDANIISFSSLLEVFWSIHDPTTLNRQGNDIGTQYRSAIFYHSELQKQQAKNSLMHNQKRFNNNIVTEISPIDIFYPAEDYHQSYFEIHGNEPYCKLVVLPKIQKFQQNFNNQLKKAED